MFQPRLDFDVAGGDFAFVGGEGGQDFGLLRLRNLEEIQSPSKLRCDLIKFGRRNPEVPVGFLRPSVVAPGLVATNLYGPPETSQTHSVRMNLRPGSLPVFGVPFPQLWVLGLLADDWVFHDGVAEVIHHRRDGEDAAQPLVQIFLRRGLITLRVRVIRSRQNYRGSAQRQPCDHASSRDGSRNVLCHCSSPQCWRQAEDQTSRQPGGEAPEHLMARGLDRFLQTKPFLDGLVLRTASCRTSDHFCAFGRSCCPLVSSSTYRADSASRVARHSE